jgi:hypothetical protein
MGRKNGAAVLSGKSPSHVMYMDRPAISPSCLLYERDLLLTRSSIHTTYGVQRASMESETPPGAQAAIKGEGRKPAIDMKRDAL